MKNFILLLIVQLCLCGCADYMPYSSSNENEKSILIQVECINRGNVETEVMQTLRMTRFNDVEKQNFDATLVIKARYQALPYDRAMRIKDELERLPGVLDILFIADGVPVKNVR